MTNACVGLFTFATIMMEHVYQLSVYFHDFDASRLAAMNSN
jgi:hypothetical protein